MDGSLFMRTLAVIAFLALAFPGRAEMDALSVSCSAAPSLPSPVLVVYGSEEPGSAEARWLKVLQPGTEERRALDEYVRDVQFVTVPRHPSVKDWEENGSLSRAAMHGVRMLPSVVFLTPKDVCSTWWKEGPLQLLCGKKCPCLRKSAARAAGDAGE